MAKTNPILLAGDIGGTKTVLATATFKNNGCEFSEKERLSSQEFHSLEETLRMYLKKHPLQTKRISACFALAGPVRDGYCKITNLPWEMREESIQQEFGFRSVKFINDFEAIGYGIFELSNSELMTIQEGKPEKNGTIAVLGAGTGLGEAYLIYSKAEERYIVHPSEGGHSCFSPKNETEIDFLRLLLTETDHVDYDTILSGSGLVRIYNYLLNRQRKSMPDFMQRAMRSEDLAAVISNAALSEEDETAERALDMFACIYGVEASNLALKTLSTGGVFVAGGIAAKIAVKLKDGRFMKSFLDKGKLKKLLEEIPVKVVLNEEAGLIGAAAIARR